MRNLFQEIIFECKASRHESIAGQMQFWHIHQNNCYPNGCELDDGCHVPGLLVSDDKYQTFLKQFQKFYRWTKKMQYRTKVSFTGIIDRIYPHYSISMIDSSPIFTSTGSVLTFNQGMIHKEFFEDPFYVFLSCNDLKELNLNENDAVSGLAHFNIDQRGIISMDKVIRMRLINSFLPNKGWDIHNKAEFSLRIVDQLDQDLCMECSHRFLVTNSRSRRRRQTNCFVCTLNSCQLMKRITAGYQEKHLPDHDYFPTSLPSLSTPDDHVQEENPGLDESY